MRAATILVLLIAAVGFAGLGLRPWLADPAPPPAPRPAPAAASAAAPLILPPPARTDFGPFTARPLFSAARRPPPPEAPGTPIADPGAGLVLGFYEITGVVMGAAGPVAMLRSEDGAMIRIRAGDDLPARGGGGAAAAKVVSITLDALTFRRGDDTVVAPVDGSRGGPERGTGAGEGSETE